MDCLFFYHRECFSYSRARIVTEYFFHESTLWYFFNTLTLHVRNAQTYRLVRCHVTKILVSVVLFMAMRGLFPLQKHAHWKTSPVKRGVPFLLCEQKRGFKDYRRFQSLMNLTALNYSHTFKRQCRNNRSRLSLF